MKPRCWHLSLPKLCKRKTDVTSSQAATTTTADTSAKETCTQLGRGKGNFTLEKRQITPRQEERGKKGENEGVKQKHGSCRVAEIKLLAHAAGVCRSSGHDENWGENRISLAK